MYAKFLSAKKRLKDETSKIEGLKKMSAADIRTGGGAFSTLRGVWAVLLGNL